MAAVVSTASPLPQHPPAPSQTTPTHQTGKLASNSQHESMQDIQQTLRQQPSPTTTPEPHGSSSPPPNIPSQSGNPNTSSSFPIPLSSAVESLSLDTDNTSNSNQEEEEEDDDDEEEDDGDSSRSAILTDAAPRVPSSSSSADNAGPDTDTDHPTPSDLNATIPLPQPAVPGPEPIVIDAPITTDATAVLPLGATATATTLKPPSTISAAAKPKSKAPKRTARPPSPPPRQPPPRQTVRLDIPLRGPGEYEVNILQLARDTNQRPLTPPPPPREGSDDESSSSDDEAVAAGLDGLPKLSVRRRKRGYDLDDPFIDDSDLFIDAPTHFAQTKQQGFYVSSGDVALVKDKSPKKPTAATGSGKGGPIVAQAQAALGLGVDLGGMSGRAGKPKGPSLTTLLTNATAVAEAPAKVAPMTTIHGEVINAPSHPSTGAPQTPNGTGAGTRDSPIALLDEDDGGDHKGRFVPPQFIEDGREGGAKRIKLDHDSLHHGHGAVSSARPSLSGYGGGLGENASMISMGGGSDAGGTKKRKISKDALEQIFNPDVTDALRGLKAEIDAAAWNQKGKFPPHLKPLLQRVAVHALRHGDYNDDFFDYLPTIFPYNRFTMMKLTSRLMYNDHQSFLEERQKALLEELRQIAIEDFPKAQEDYAKASTSWVERQKKKEMIAAAGGVLVVDGAGEGLMDVDSRGPSPGGVGAASGVAPMDTGLGDPTPSAVAGANKREEKAPVPRYKWTEPIKARVWGLVHLSNEMVRLSAQMAQWDKEFQNTISDHSKKKELYAKIVAAFPDGWMNTGVISREISAMKAKLKKESEIVAGVGAVSGGDVSS
ncbi:hypothetical protein FRB94_010924 [Tulasnella sp. JGI-2019a]|nr:hypothetical protein FRB93_003743 [Tulasnella sp. JGI-2019a]KAG8993270.1 hypothetical protein FRB94_010924 [Tulasnella sp. JGI-2019a]